MVPPCSFSHYEVNRNEFCSEDLEVDQRHLVSIAVASRILFIFVYGKFHLLFLSVKYFVTDTLNWASTRNLSI